MGGDEVEEDIHSRRGFEPSVVGFVGLVRVLEATEELYDFFHRTENHTTKGTWGRRLGHLERPAEARRRARNDQP